MTQFKLFNPANPEAQYWLLDPGSYLVGREKDCDIVINDRTVSRQHAQLDIQPDLPVQVADLGSRNGVRINQQRISKTGNLNPRDRVTFGDVTLVLESADDGSPSTLYDADLTITEQPTRQVVVGGLSYAEALAGQEAGDATIARAFKALTDMAGMLVAYQDLKSMCDEALKRLSAIVDGQRFAVFLSREDSDGVTMVSSHLMNPTDSRNFSISRSILREVLGEKKAVYFSDISGDQRFTGHDSIVLQGIRSAMAVPLIDQDKVLGVLYMDTTVPGQRYDEKSLKLAATCGHMLAAKITQHHLLKEQQAKQALESELRLAARMQRDLMPADLPKVGGYTFHAHLDQSRLVGGDLYDIGVLSDGRILFLQADVSGKGMGAALLASNVLSAFRILRVHSPFDLANAVRQVSLQLLASSRMSDFATLFIGVLDPKAHRIEFVNAGHNPPLFIPSKGRISELKSGELPIGVIDDAEWTPQSMPINPGDRLLMYTDGLLDAANAADEMYGRERILAYVESHRTEPAAELAENLVEEVDRFMGDTPPHDDLTLMVLAREPV